MSEPQLEPLPEDLEALLRHERVVPPETAVSAAQVWDALQPQLGAAPVAVPAKGLAGLAGGKLAVAAISFAVGAGTVALISALSAPHFVPTIVFVPVPGAPPVAVEAPAEELPAPPPPPLTRAPVRPPPAPPVAAPVAAAAPEAPPKTADEELAEERALLELARTALSRARIDDAVAALKDHETRFPKGRLAEERESLWIRSLISTGRRAEARERVKRFRTDFPASIMLPALEQALGENQ